MGKYYDTIKELRTSESDLLRIIVRQLDELIELVESQDENRKRST